MAIAFISDLHLTPERPESTKWFEEFMARSQGALEQIYILGDLFEFWVGDDGRDALGQGDVEKIISATSKMGIELFFIHGNRDFLVGESFEQRTGCQILPDPSIIMLGSDRVLLTHGDSLCIDDIEHQKARKQMTTSKWKIAFLEQSVEKRMDSAFQIRQKSELGKQTKNKNKIIMDVNQSHVEKVMREYNVFTLIHGHTHRPAIHEFTLDGQLAKRYVLGDWYTQKSMLIYDKGSFTLKK